MFTPQGGLSKGPCQLSPSPHSDLNWDSFPAPPLPSRVCDSGGQEDCAVFGLVPFGKEFCPMFGGLKEFDPLVPVTKDIFPE